MLARSALTVLLLTLATATAWPQSTPSTETPSPQGTEQPAASPAGTTSDPAAPATQPASPSTAQTGDWHTVSSITGPSKYGESFERNVGAGSPLKLERGLNALWTQGGLMYAWPVR